MTEALDRGMPTDELLDLLAGKSQSGDTLLPVRAVSVALVAEAAPANGGMFSWQNPLGVAVLAALIIDVTTVSTGAATVNAGVGSAAATSNDTLVDGADVNAAADAFSSLDSTHGGTNGRAMQKVDAKGGTNDWITGTASADSSGLVGRAYILYIPIS